MSLLTISQAVLEEVGLGAPNSVIGSSDRSSKQILRLINREGKILAKKSWTVLQKEYTFTTTGADYMTLPTDFGYILDETAWDRDSYWSMRGGISAREWQTFKSGILASTLRLGFRLRPLNGVNKLYLDPTPASGVQGVFEYVSSQWVANAEGDEFKEAYAQDGDRALISEELIELGAMWRFKNAKGLAYEEEHNDYLTQVDNAFARDGGKSVLNMGKPVLPNWRMNLPEGNFG